MLPGGLRVVTERMPGSRTFSVGAYVAGSNARIDDALARRGAIDAFLRQPADELESLDAARSALEAL